MIKISTLVLSSLVLASCSGGSSSKNEAAAGSGGGGNTGAIQGTTLKDLSLSNVLAISLPESVKGAASLRLTEGAQKSFEACQLRQNIREGVDTISNVKKNLCMLENGTTLEFGKKTNIDFSTFQGSAGGPGGVPPEGGPGGVPPGGPGLTQGGMPTSMQVWIDDSAKASGKVVVWMCQDKKLQQMIEVEGAVGGKSKGRMVMKMEMGGEGFDFSVHSAVSFDNKLSQADRSKITIKDLMEMGTGNEASKSRRLLALDLSEAGVSKVANSVAGNFGGLNHDFRSVGFFDSQYGSVIAVGSNGVGESSFEFSSASYFDAQSNHVDISAIPAASKVTADLVPGYLPENFQPEDFPANAWNCETDTEASFSADGGKIEACMAEWSDIRETDCFDQAAFGSGTSIEVSAEAGVDASTFEGFDDSGAEEPAPAAGE